MKIVIIGSGNIATYYGVRFEEAGHQIVQVLSPNLEHATTLATRLHCEAIQEYTYLNREADIYILGVSDNTLYELAETLKLPGKLIIYGAGAIPLSVLQPISEHIICIWCMFSINKDKLPTQRQFPVIYNTLNEKDQELALQWASILSDAPYLLSDHQKARTHLTAVFVNNFTNHLYAIAHQLMTESNIDFSLLMPMIQDTAQRIQFELPEKLQTGPAVRNDTITLNQQINQLEDHPHFQLVYKVLSDSIRHMYKQL